MDKNKTNCEYPVYFWERGGYCDLVLIVAAIACLVMRMGV